MNDRIPDAHAVVQQLRAALGPLMDAHAGRPARGVRLTRELGLDKSLASRLVRACASGSEGEFVHHLPSPTGLRKLLDAALGRGSNTLNAAAAVDSYQQLLDRLPGHRQALEAQLGCGSRLVRERLGHASRQAVFKAQSYLFGHGCDTMASALFLWPAADGPWVDALEVHRRRGLWRVQPDVAVPLLSVMPHSAGTGGATMAPLHGRGDPADYLLGPAVALQVLQDGPVTTLVLPAELDPLPDALDTAYLVRQALPLARADGWQRLRNYMLHTPCKQVCRELYLARDLWPSARIETLFQLPSPSGVQLPDATPERPHHRRLALQAQLVSLGADPLASPPDGLPDHAAVLHRALALAGLSGQVWRGWRSELAYPLPLVEMQWLLQPA
ncbi:hypothetical protein KAK06_14640 [Ideonella sp. 4Y11]|uniref:Uncharacterized protein n=1 Tax=Ideonella aquatica TaxID=2824119 RepID=A0A940YIN7_9BURK|nr:hypothetical protein [Ideonella aquatica]MBQ0960189.1 hypothetical protein [Ideonella aquatica]